MSSFILKYVAVDKLLHFLISYSLSITGILLLKNKIIPLIIVFFIGLAKEVLDSKEVKNYFSIPDLIADVLGVAAAGMISYLM